MRLLELHLEAFGPFSDRRLDLSGGPEPGLTVVYGPNEAGKSSALRAIHDLLYGIPVRSADDFVHAHRALRIGARLRFEDGEELAFVRRKGSKRTLLDAESGEPIEAPRLEALVERVPEPLFQQLYGLDHRQLADGSEALLADEGELGRALFGAGLGIAGLRRVLDGLDAEAASLFAPRASKPRINAGLARWRELEARAREASLPVAEWTRCRQALEDAEGRLAELERELGETRAELSRHRRIQLTRPVLGRLRETERALASLSETRPLADDFAERWRRAREEREQALQARQRALRAIERHRERLETEVPDPALLEQRERIEALNRQLGAQRKTREDLPRRESELAGLDRDLDELLAGLGESRSPERLASLQRATSRAAGIRERASEAAGLAARRASLREDLDEAGAECARLERARGQLPSPVDFEPLRRARHRASGGSGLDDKIEKQAQRVEGLERDLRRAHERLGPDAPAIDSLERLAVPSEATIQAFDARVDEDERERQRLEEDERRMREERRGLDESLHRLRARGRVPSERELGEIRAERNRAWRAVRRVLVPGEDGDDEAVGRSAREALGERFERRLDAADRVADGLRSDAERVAEQTSLHARRERLETALEALDESKRTHASRAEDRVGEWRSLWAPLGIEPQAPRVMLDWRRGLDSLLARSAELSEARRELAGDERRRRALLDALEAAMAPLDPESEEGGAASLEAGLGRAEALLARHEEAVRERERVEEALGQASERRARVERALERCEAERSSWREGWREAVAELGLGDAPRPSDAQERLDVIGQVVEKDRERRRMEERVEKMRDDLAGFEENVAALPCLASAELERLGSEAAVTRIFERLDRAKTQAAVRENVERECAAALEEQTAADETLAALALRIEALIDEAGVEEEAGIDVALRAWEGRRTREQERDRDRRDLAERAGGRPLEALEAESREAPTDALDAHVERLEVRAAELDDERKAAAFELQSRRDALARLDGRDDAARLAEQAQAELATLRREVGRYVELRLARRMLGAEIEEYQRVHQGPVLGRTGALFASLTGGAYRGVLADQDEKGRARLLAVAASGQSKAVPALSAGTRDQLFLALRLATLESALRHAEPMPWIADDILVDFDDERARNGLAVLAELARENQILLFSHHLHISEIAREIGDGTSVVEL